MLDESVVRRIVYVELQVVGYRGYWKVWKVCAEIVRWSYHGISFNYYVYKYIEIVRIVIKCHVHMPE